MSDGLVTPTWATRELPILVALYERFEADAGRPTSIQQLEEVRRAIDVAPSEFIAGVRALAEADPPYVDVEFGNGWTPQKGGAGWIESVSERTREQLGAWPTPDDVLDQLVLALGDAAKRAYEPDDKSRLETAAGVLAGMARDIAVTVIATRIGQV